MATYRAPMRSRLDSVDRSDAGDAVDRALELGLVGVGGRLTSPPRDLDDAVARVAVEHDERVAARLERFAAVPDGSEVWTRDATGAFHRGEVAGPWGYDADPAAYAVDLCHVRPCRWDAEPLGEHQLPPAVAATFRRGGRNFQQVHGR